MKRLFSYLLILFLCPFLAKAQNLEVEGDAKIGGLGGNGTEMVVTDNDGNLSTQAIPGGGGSSVWSLNGLKTYYNDGNVGIGITDPDATLHLLRPFSTSVNEPMLKIEHNSNQSVGAKTGLSIFTSIDGNTGRNGIQNVTSQTSTANGTFYGIINNNFPGGSGTSYGIRNLVANSNTPTGMMYGVSNSVISHPSSSSTTYGVYSLLEKNGTGKHIGLFNKISGSDGDTALVSINTDPTGFAGYFRGNVRMQDADLTVDGNVGIGTAPAGAYNLEIAGDARVENILVNTVGSSFTDAIAVSGQYQEGLSVFSQFFSNFQSIYGVKSEATAAGMNQIVYGVYGHAGLSNGSNTAYGVYASKGAGGAGGSYALYVNGEAFKTATGGWVTSDRRLKRNIRPIESAVDIIQQLKPSTYLYRKGGKYDLLNFPERQQYGFIAQEVEEVLPDLVQTTKVQFHENVRTPGSEEQFSEEYKAMNYEMLIPVLTQGIKEQQEQIEKTTAENKALRQKVSEIEQHNQALEARLTKLEQLLTQNTSTAPGDRSTQVVELNAVKLYQNEPNPFNRSTRIAYDIPNDVKSASLYITTADGKPIKQIPIAQRGSGQTILQAGTLPAGRYQYTLLLDGKITATKQMVLTK